MKTREQKLRVFLALIILAVLFLFYYFDVQSALTLENVQETYEDLADLRVEHPLITALGFFLIFCAWTALSFPMAFILSVSAGAFFGIWMGTLLAVCATTVGSTLAFLSSRYVLRGWVEQRFAVRLASVDRGIEQNAFSFILLMRFFMIMPYFVTNLLAGVTRIRPWVYVSATALGILPENIVFAAAGEHLSSLRSFHELFSARFLILMTVLILLVLLHLIYGFYKGKHLKSPDRKNPLI